MMRRWVNGRRSENTKRRLQPKDVKAERCKQKSCEVYHNLVVVPTQMKTGETENENKRKIAGWSTKMWEESVNRLECEDTEEMVQWRSVS